MFFNFMAALNAHSNFGAQENVQVLILIKFKMSLKVAVEAWRLTRSKL